MPFDPGSLSAITPEIVLTAAALAVLLADLWWPETKRYQLAYLGMVGVLASLVTLFASSPAGERVLGGMIVTDSMSFFFRTILLAVTFLVLMVAVRYVRRKVMLPGEFYALVMFAGVGMMFMANGADLIPLYLGLELTSISTYVLAGMLKHDDKSNEAALKYMLNGAIASAVLLFGFSLVFGLTGSSDLGVIASALADGSASPEMAIMAVIFVIAGFGFKIALVPFHMWAPDTYEGSPTPIVAFLSAATKVAAFAFILRVFLQALPHMSQSWSLILAVLAFVTMTVGNLTALVQNNIKRMLAYSSISQLGYVLVGLAVFSQRGLQAVLYYLLVYAFVELGAFGVVVAFSNHQDSYEIDDYAGLSERAPRLAAALVLFFLSFVGIPPTGGFFGKLLLYGSAVEAGFTWLAVAIALNSAISLGYYFNVVRRMYFMAPNEPEEGEEAEETLEPAGFSPSWSLQLALGVSVVMTLALGIAPQAFLDWVSQAAVLLGG